MARKFVLALCLAAASAFVAPSSSVRASAPLQNAVLDPFAEIQKTIDVVDDSQLLTKVARQRRSLPQSPRSEPVPLAGRQDRSPVQARKGGPQALRRRAAPRLRRAPPSVFDPSILRVTPAPPPRRSRGGGPRRHARRHQRRTPPAPAHARAFLSPFPSPPRDSRLPARRVSRSGDGPSARRSASPARPCRSSR